MTDPDVTEYLKAIGIIPETWFGKKYEQEFLDAYMQRALAASDGLPWSRLRTKALPAVARPLFEAYRDYESDKVQRRKDVIALLRQEVAVQNEKRKLNEMRGIFLAKICGKDAGDVVVNPDNNDVHLITGFAASLPWSVLRYRGANTYYWHSNAIPNNNLKYWPLVGTDKPALKRYKNIAHTSDMGNPATFTATPSTWAFLLSSWVLEQEQREQALELLRERKD